MVPDLHMCGWFFASRTRTKVWGFKGFDEMGKFYLRVEGLLLRMWENQKMVFILTAVPAFLRDPLTVRAPCLCVTESPGWTGFVDNEGSLLVSRRAGVMSDLTLQVFPSSLLYRGGLFSIPFFFLKSKTKTFIFLGGVAFIPGLFLFLEFLQGIFFLLYDLLFWF